MLSNFKINKKNIILYLMIAFISAVLFFLWYNFRKPVQFKSDLTISLSLVKDIKPSLMSEINRDIAICYKPRRWDTETCTMFLAKCDDSTYCLKTNIEPIEDVHDWVLIEYKNIGPDKIILLGDANGYVFSAWHIYDPKSKLIIDDSNYRHTDKNQKTPIDERPCPITLKSQQSYYVIMQSPPHPFQKSSSMQQFMYYKPITDSVYKYWLSMPENKITNNPLQLLEKYRGKIMPKEYIISRSILTNTYIESKFIAYQDSLIKSWIND